MTAKTFDYIVVGSGTAGSVIAARLTEDPSTRVLLVEAGSATPLPDMAVPAAWPTLLGTSAGTISFTTPQAAGGPPVVLATGRGLGGSSSINGMVFARGHRSGYDAWAGYGVKGWGFDDLLPYFQRSENAAGGDPELRGTGGPLTVGPADPPNAVVAAALDAAASAGHRRARDISGGLEEGFGLPDLTITDGRRQSAYDAYLRPALARPNLTIVTDSQAERVLVEDGRCTGITYTSGGNSTEAHAAVEVVLCAGAIGTAQLLMLSGIGPAEHLTEVGVPVVHDLPGVGANFQDHPLTGLIYESAQPVPPAQFNHTEAIGLIRSSAAVEQADLHIVFVDFPAPVPGFEGPAQGYTIGVGVMTPYSRGTVRLADSRPTSPPVLDPNYFGDERDVAAVVSGLKTAREIGQQPALDSWRKAETLPGPATVEDEALAEYAKKATTSYFHYAGTCAMGDGPMSVVDAELRVRGLTGLRVADASVMPSLPAANTNATVCAIAEKAADLLRHTGR